MAKLIMAFFAVAALVQLIKPLGWPGLKYRRDAWKLAVAGFFVVIAVVSLRPEAEDTPANGAPQQTPASPTR